ncbi:MAG TPA: O-antigen ligase family protein [Conexibacter sp.]|jgi:putative inorganic carbon (HCO3(-)) transporter|nr:O-antigen ligase family protein [Conexibacter sp.]
MTPLFALAGPLPKAGAVVAVLLAAGALLARDQRQRALAMMGALLLAPVLLLADIWSSPQLAVMRDHPLPAAAAAIAGIGAVAALALLMARRPLVLPLLTILALPFRVPIQVGGTTSNLLVPLYLVIAAGALAAIVAGLREGDAPQADAPARWAPGWLERLLALSVALYGIQATYSADFDKALQQIAFFIVPFALLFVLLARVAWTPRLLRLCLGLLVGLALVFSAIGYVEYATKHIFLNPKLLASNDLHTYFRTNSVFFDPNIYGRFLVVAMLAVAATMLQSARAKLVWAGAAVLAALWAGLVLTLSQSSLGALLVGLTTLAVLRWGAKRVLLPAAAVAALAVAAVLVTPSTFGVNLHNLDSSSSGRTQLVSGGGALFRQRPIAGYGSGAFVREYRRYEGGNVSPDAATASHTIPITVAAEQGVIGLLAYLALLAAALARLLGRRAGTSIARSAVAAAFLALVFHTLVYAAFLEDPLTWALLGIGTALAAAAAPRPAPVPDVPARPPTAAERSAARRAGLGTA